MASRQAGILNSGSVTSQKIDEAEFNDPAFDYVVELKVEQKVCFGSTIPRNTAPIGKGLSAFQKRIAPELFKQGPGSYHYEKFTGALYPLLHKVRSKKGVSPLASQEKRFKEKFTRTPSPGRYEVLPKRDARKAHAPFGIGSKKLEKDNDIPGPATYDVRKVKKCRRTRFMSNFGRPSMVYAVETICVPVPSDTCQKCEELCQGDYWHKDYATFLCHLCWVEERSLEEIYTKKELKEFKKIRNCSFMHNHEGTDAATLILPHNKIKKKLRLENYLELYLDC
ncbi:uncharacterized protein LOC126740907 [Anthonomus grandis grandis]|uniref:uncharacterized protein LOC126740907 n=1 Tax=Anthonomus grandis grandis TaxID=2921223 RepID=UPI00216539AB|nr:uncharacterized protein LOC126740907 [Anthonomus grandis grandis]